MRLRLLRGLTLQGMRTWAIATVVAFPLILLLSPRIKKVVATLTE